MNKQSRAAGADIDAGPGWQSLQVLGWREWIGLPDLRLNAIKVKLDSGARSSSLHVEAIEEFALDGAPWVRFLLDPRTRSGTRGRWFEAPIVDRRRVTDSGGHASLRPFIRTRVRLAGDVFVIEMNLSDRRGMMFPMLLGRTAMAGRILVDPARSYLLGNRPRRTSRPSEPE